MRRRSCHRSPRFARAGSCVCGRAVKVMPRTGCAGAGSADRLSRRVNRSRQIDQDQVGIVSRGDAAFRRQSGSGCGGVGHHRTRAMPTGSHARHDPPRGVTSGATGSRRYRPRCGRSRRRSSCPPARGVIGGDDLDVAPGERCQSDRPRTAVAAAARTWRPRRAAPGRPRRTRDSAGRSRRSHRRPRARASAIWAMPRPVLTWTTWRAQPVSSAKRMARAIASISAIAGREAR